MARIKSPLAETENQFRVSAVERKWNLADIASDNLRVVSPVRLSWPLVRATLVIRFLAAGIVSCEVRQPGCTGMLYTGFAHDLRRRFIKTLEEMERVVLACSSCHGGYLDAHGSDHTKREIAAIISRRREQP